MMERRIIDWMIVVPLKEWKWVGVDLELEILEKFHKTTWVS
jgi:hypothetical protein